MEVNEKVVSVVMAHYNAGKYVLKGLVSLANQTMNQDDFEVIIVDDKSTKSLENIEDFQAKIKNLKIINEQENHGYPSIPRNHGIDIASGRYIMLMDQDDYLANDALEKMVACADKNSSDIVIGKYASGEGYNGTQVPFTKGNIEKVNPCTDHIVSVLAPHKLYRKSMLNEHSIRFYDNSYIPVAEDQVFNMRAYSAAKNISILADKDYYFWKQRDDLGNLGKSSTYVYDEPWKYLNVLREVFNAINLSTVWSYTQKQRVKAIYLGRIFNSNGTVMKTISLQKTSEKKQELINGLKSIIDEHMDLDSIWDVRQVCQYMVVGIKKGMTFSELKDFKNIIFKTSFKNNIEIFKGKTVRNMVVKGEKVRIPVDFLNFESIRMVNIDYYLGEISITISVQNDLNLSSPDEVQLLLINRATKEEYICSCDFVRTDRNIFSIGLKFDDFITANVFKEGVFDFFIVIQRNDKVNRYRLGQNKNELLSKSRSIKFENRKFRFYYTAGFSNLSLQVTK